MILGLAVFLTGLTLITTYRVWVGPTVPDRLIGADTAGIFLAMIMLLTGLHYNMRVMVDVVLVFSIFLFTDLLIFAKYYEHGELFK